ncbi:hypothetical protein TPHA_0I02880 [Tetrapisispora phaffii CBS 4417]|uniref:Peptidase M16 N-terminal domain-containing protein n=1 Tax=Tetrapisispora phaffii (strain ATCC 24235 / CBS 4417 / NBRC 1672 / NRRL Y-8282 / UCD 70-5) TaxID=1071381 RepID=G8BY11_TETPH|nr:hypothetical protein TPHA_0I02880 [Tetrapisispora phaffii CBS 4417]CCE64789.1 hypothetical protein TPHA_0I02880 [Tetrapisispora phaffii CBS 4417]
MLRNSNNLVKNGILRRFLSTRPEVTELSNGVSVVTRYNPNVAHNTTGLVFGSGSSAENPYNNGVSHVCSSLFSRHNKKVNADAVKQGFKLDSLVDREYQSFLVTSAGSANLAKALDCLNTSFAETTQNVNQSDFDQSKTLITEELYKLENKNKFQQERVMEHLHSTAFQNTPLSLPKRGTMESVQSLVTDDLKEFASVNYNNTNVIVVNEGNIQHNDFIELLESKNFKLSNEHKPTLPKSTFLGSEVRLRDDTLPKAYFAIAVEGESIRSPDYLTSQVAAEIFGSYNALEPKSRLQGVKLIDQFQEYNIAEMYDHFSLSYKDSGLWGFRAVTSEFNSIDEVVHFTLKQWNRLTISITETELARGKQLLKLKLASNLESNPNVTQIVSELGYQALNGNIRPTLAEQFALIDKITVKDIKNWASKRLWDQDVAIAGSGQIEGLLDYMRIRNDMSMMRW